MLICALGETLYSKASGSRTFDTSRGEDLRTDTPIWIASITKLLTALACVIAVDQGLIGLDDDVRQLVPELKDLDLLVGFEESDQKPRAPIVEKMTEPISLR